MPNLLGVLIGLGLGRPHPDYDGVVDGVAVWLDFPRSACREFKHGLMAVIEYQGIAAKWGVLEFLFAQFCYGQAEPCQTTADWCDDPPDEGVNCIGNPPGYDPDLGFVSYDGDSYR